MSNQLKSNYQRLVEAHGLTVSPNTKQKSQIKPQARNIIIIIILIQICVMQGDLVIDWEQETLVYYVSPDKMADLRAKQNYLKKDGEEVISDK